MRKFLAVFSFLLATPICGANRPAEVTAIFGDLPLSLPATVVWKGKIASPEARPAREFYAGWLKEAFTLAYRSPQRTQSAFFDRRWVAEQPFRTFAFTFTDTESVRLSLAGEEVVELRRQPGQAVSVTPLIFPRGDGAIHVVVWMQKSAYDRATLTPQPRGFVSLAMDIAIGVHSSADLLLRQPAYVLQNPELLAENIGDTDAHAHEAGLRFVNWLVGSPDLQEYPASFQHQFRLVAHNYARGTEQNTKLTVSCSTEVANEVHVPLKPGIVPPQN